MQYPIAIGYFRTQLHKSIGDAAYRRIQRGKRCKLFIP